MAPMTQNNPQSWSPFDSSPIEIPRPNHQFSQAPTNLKNFSPIIEPSWNNGPSQSMLYSSWNDGQSSPFNACSEVEFARPIQIPSKNQRPAMLVNNMYVNNMIGYMQQQWYHHQSLPNRFMQFEASAFVDLMGKHSRGTGVFHPPNPYFTNNMPSDMKSEKMQSKEEVEVPPSKNSHQVSENGLAERKENTHDSLLVDINLPEKWTY